MQVTDVLHLHDSQSLDSQRVAVLYNRRLSYRDQVSQRSTVHGRQLDTTAIKSYLNVGPHLHSDLHEQL